MAFTKFTKQPILSTVIFVVIVILGFIGLATLPIEQCPDIASPTASVWIIYIGADAETVKNSVLAPLEENINGVENMEYMTSQATNADVVQTTIYFRQGANPDMCAANVQNRASQVQALLPTEMNRVGIAVPKRQTSRVLMYTLMSKDGKYDDRFLTNYNNINIIPAIKRVRDAGDVWNPDMKTCSMRIWLKPSVMKQYGLMPPGIADALIEQNVEAVPDSFGEQSNMACEYVMHYKGHLRTADEFGNIILHSTQMEQALKLKDAAKIELDGLAYAVSICNNNQPSSTGVVQQIVGSNADDTAKMMKAELKDQVKSFPPGMEYKTNYDVTELLYASITEVLKTLIITLLLVFLVVYIFLQDFRPTLIPLITVPVSLIGAFFFLQLFGFSINLLTLSAPLPAIAIVADDTIVVVKVVHAKLDLGYRSTLTASIGAMDEIASVITSIILVMAMMFVPVSFVGGTSGTSCREFDVIMAVSTIISALNTLTLSPALCAIFLKSKNEDEIERKMSRINCFHVSLNTSYEKILGEYKNRLQKLARKPVLTGVFILVGAIALLLIMKTTKTGLVPDEGTGTPFCTVSMPPAASVVRTQQVIDQVNVTLTNNPAIQGREQLQGYSFITGQESDQAIFIIKLKPFSEHNTGQSVMAVLGMIYRQTAQIKDVQILALAPPMIPGFALNNGASLVPQDKAGGDLNKLFQVTKAYLVELNKRPEIQTTMISYSPNYPQYLIDADVARCKQAGISSATVLGTLQGYCGGTYASNFSTYGKLYHVMIQDDVSSRGRPEGLNDIYIRTPGNMAFVQSFISMKRVFGPSGINRFDMSTSINVQVTLNSDYSTGETIQVAKGVAAIGLLQGYGYDFSGLPRLESGSSNVTGTIFVLCFLFVYLILTAQYKSYLLLFVVILFILFGLAGAFLFMQLFGHNNDIYIQTSLIMLIDLLARNAILIVQFTLEGRHTGMATTWSAILGSGARLRPILIVSLVMVIGLLPMMFIMGAERNGNQTLRAAAVGGMSIGMSCQLFVVPDLLVIFQALQERFTPIRLDDEGNSEAEAELRRYVRRPVGIIVGKNNRE